MIQRTGDGPVDCPTTVAGGHGREDQGGGVAGRTAWPRGPLKLHYSEGVAFIRAETHGSGSEIAERVADRSDCACTADRQPDCSSAAFPRSRCWRRRRHKRNACLKPSMGG
jgi:hypothetical protein